MRPAAILFVFLFCLQACEKPPVTPSQYIVTDLEIVAATTPLAANRNQPIVTQVSMTGPNQCYRFLHFQVAVINPFLFEIRAKATVPNPDAGTVVCTPQVYTKDTTLSIPTHLAGKHVLRFYNGSQLFEVDTVTIN